MFDTNIKISVTANAGANNEMLLKPRGERKLQFAGASKQKNLRQQLANNFSDYESALTDKSWSVLQFLSHSNNSASADELKNFIYPGEEGNGALGEEFFYRLKYLNQLGLLEQSTGRYEISTVGKALLDVASNRNSSVLENAQRLVAMQPAN